MLKDVHCMDETDCNVFLNEMGSELDLNSTLEENMISDPCCLLIRRKLHSIIHKSYIGFKSLILLERPII